MKYTFIILLVLSSLLARSQVKDTTRNILLNKDTLLTIKTTVNKTASVGYTETSVLQIVKPFQTPPVIDTTTPPPPPPPPPTTPSKYEGFGSQAIGGGNSSDTRTVRTATEFKNALGSNRTIKFGANVTITGVTISNSFSYCTIDANGFDVRFNGINDDGISFDGPNFNHIILTGVAVTNCTGDGINVVGGAHDIVIDHCTATGNQDGNIDIAADNSGRTKNVTVQWCYIGPTNGGSGLMLVTGQSVSVHHNIFNGNSGGEASEREPFIHASYSPPGSPNCDFRNNLVAAWGRYASGLGYNATANFVNNYYAQNKGGAIDFCADPSGCSSKGFVSGNVGGSGIPSGVSEFVIPSPYKVTITDARTAAAAVKAGAGSPVKNSSEKNAINAITVQ